MAGVVSVEVHQGPAAPTADEAEMTVIVKMRFSQPEADEDMNYGVNVVLFQHYQNVQYAIFQTSMSSMLVDLIPEKIPAPKFVSGTMTIKPEGAGLRSVRFLFKLKTVDFPSGTALQALATVVPEISATFGRSATTTVPSAAATEFPAKVTKEDEP